MAAHGRTDPIDIDDDALLLLRDCLAGIDLERRREIGLRVGCVVRVRAYSWIRTGQRKSREHPADCYLPSAIDRDPDSWARAAATRADRAGSIARTLNCCGRVVTVTGSRRRRSSASWAPRSPRGSDPRDPMTPDITTQRRQSARHLPLQLSLRPCDLPLHALRIFSRTGNHRTSTP